MLLNRGKWLAWLCPLLILAGCWDRREVNDIAIVASDAFDKEGDQFRITVQFPLPGQLGGPGGGGGGTSGEKSWYVDSMLGPTLKDADSKLQLSISRRLYYAHRRVLLIGEAFARWSLPPALDISARIPQNRMTTFLVVTKGPAYDILNADAVMEQSPSEMIRELAVNSMKNPRTVKEALNILLSDGIDLALPYMIMEKSRPGDKGESKLTITMEGLGIFHKDKLMGYIKADEAQGVLWAMGQHTTPSLTLDAPEGNGKIVLQFSETKVGYKPVIHNEDDIEMTIRIEAKGYIFENESNFKTADHFPVLQELANEKLKQLVEKSLKQLQTEYGADVIGFGEIIHRRHPNTWEKIGRSWDKLYPKVRVQVDARLQLEHTGTLIKPIYKGSEGAEGPP